MTTALLFPGQGSQFIGMGKDLYESFSEAKEVFQEVDDALEQKLSKLMFEGDIDELTITSNTQPAIMAVSIAAFRVFIKQGGFDVANEFRYFAGHSLGEYSAHAAAGTFSLRDTAKLLRTRGDAMLSAVPAGVGGMVALVGAEPDQAESLVKECLQFGSIQIANDNGAGQIVLSGHIKAIDAAVEKSSAHGVKRAIKLNVTTPFHSELIKPAEHQMEAALQEVNASKPLVPVVANYSVTAVTEVSDIKQLLVKQISGKVRWRETMDFLSSEGVDTFIEIGPNKVLSTIAKRMTEGAQIYSIQSCNDIEQFLNR